MHELSIALSILEVVGEEVLRRGLARVVAIHLKLGPLSGVAAPALASAYCLARMGSSLEEVELVIEQMPLVVYCPACGRDSSAASPQLLCCGQCGTPTPQVVSGREMEIAALEVET